MTCDCCPKACVEIKCPFSIAKKSPLDPDVRLPFMKKGKINKTHRYYTQCLVQMGVTEITRSYFVVWTPNGCLIDTVEYDEEKWKEMKENLLTYYFDYYLSSFLEH